jgi:hypothetical protein
VAEPGDRRDVYALMTIYWETDPIHAVGQVWSMSRAADKGVTGRTVLNTNDGLSSLWASPEGDTYLAAGDGGVCLLRGDRLEQVKDTFAATGVYPLRDRLAFVEPVQRKPRVIIFDPTHVRPWTGWLG